MGRRFDAHRAEQCVGRADRRWEPVRGCRPSWCIAVEKHKPCRPVHSEVKCHAGVAVIRRMNCIYRTSVRLQLRDRACCPPIVIHDWREVSVAGWDAWFQEDFGEGVEFPGEDRIQCVMDRTFA